MPAVRRTIIAPSARLIPIRSDRREANGASRPKHRIGSVVRSPASGALRPVE